MMFEGRQNFGGAIPTTGLLKPTSLVGHYGHLGYHTPDYVPNQTYHDHTVEFEKVVPAGKRAELDHDDAHEHHAHAHDAHEHEHDHDDHQA
jgi:hypothetical protein